jgi:hypothetical protein
VPDQLVIIESGLGQGLFLGVNTASPPPGAHGVCVSTTVSDPNGISWGIHPLFGTQMFYLVHAATGYVCSFNGGNGNILLIDQQIASGVGQNLGQLITTNDVGEGFVALNNYNLSLVFDVRGASPTPGTNVIGYGWNKGPNQFWRMNPVD